MQNRIKLLRKNAGMSMEALADKAGTTKATIMKLETGVMKLTTDWMLRLAKGLNCPITQLIETNERRTTHIVGEVGAGAIIIPYDDHAKGAGLEEVDLPAHCDESVVAVRVRGDSMYPMLRDGWILFYRREFLTVPNDCIGALCVAETADGRCYVKELSKGSKKGCYNLISHNAPIMENVPLKWAAKVLDIRPR